MYIVDIGKHKQQTHINTYQTHKQGAVMKTIRKIKVSNIVSESSGREVVNQFIINTPEGIYF